MNVVEAGSGEEALKRLLHDDFAVILLDVQMPNMDGFETAELIKRRSKTQDIPIIFLTAIDKEQQKVFRGYSVGAVDYMFKPFDPEVLRSKVAVFVDLYEKSRRLQESEERFRAAFLNAPIGIGLVDPDGCWLQVNKALCDIVGRAQSELVGEYFTGVLVPDDRGPAEADMRAMLAGERTAYQAERQYLHADGFPVDVLVSVSLARDGEGEPLNFVVQVLDMTERKAAERERAERMQEQTARVEAEAIADTIRKLQTITDVALRHLSLDDLLRGLLGADLRHPRGRGRGYRAARRDRQHAGDRGDLRLRADRRAGFPGGAGRGLHGAHRGDRQARDDRRGRRGRAARAVPAPGRHRLAAGRAAAQRRAARSACSTSARPGRASSRTRTPRCSSWPPIAPRWRSSTRAPTSASAASSRRSSDR